MLVFTKFKMVEQPTRYAVPTSRELAVSVPRVVSAAYNTAVERLLGDLGFSESAIAQANVRIGNKFEIDGFMKYVPLEVAERLISPPQIQEAEIIDTADVAVLEASQSAGRMLVKLLQLIRIAMCLDWHYDTAYTSRWEEMVGAQVRRKRQARRQKRAVTFAVVSLSFIGYDSKKQLTLLRTLLENSFLSPWFADMGRDLTIINAGHQVVYPFPQGDHMENIFLTASDSFHGLIAAFTKDKQSRQKEFEYLEEENSFLRVENNDLKETVEVLKADNINLKETVEVLKADINLKETVEVLKADNINLKETVEVFKADNRALEEGMRQLNLKVEALLSKVTALDKKET
eukprot:Blabericola_migrator_1__10405@NODE_587_length_7461_cov_69_370571_g434_i0_p2_GENE_NODE_587_length_7461_cov_69_370571_g434_i0NODE_587_length_7461_cov_69_370571_g434_i0_p2_ORF_typecomplete_len346_score72_38ZapB/PF06005_12/0_021ZapB/PF06005_12/0_017KASH_CCD/PF14662_6/0_00012KASH_CCD/PF14662_6/0_66WEMBL/PF05701_11/0_002GAS/PF13851_6/0_0039HOOK/PF05622_12/0_0033HAP1_N/PF04849_13/0_0066SHE3/PF17078_5/0_22SHE3/PF17078_5/0_94Rab5bind/PF09311_11/0_011CENPF_leu_zip/PF10473_9/0_18BicD/PF09730_9/0_013TSC22/P